ncbi:MAG: hypothetical protein HC897_04080, partial [Thermoanaerobaculia bacterium]|nr:hypothetical protein [Thermoanaerobaculia bacterium]
MPSLANVERVSHAVSRYRLLQLEHLVLTSEADKARLEAAMGRLEEEMAGFLEVQRTLASAVDEVAALERVRRAWYRFVTSTHRDFLPSSRIVNTGAVHPALSRLNPLYQDVLDTAQGLAEATGRRATLALRDVQRAYDGSKGVFLVETVAALDHIEAIAALDRENEYVVVARTGYTPRLHVGPNVRFIEYDAAPVSLKTVFALHALIRRENVDAVHSHY